MAYFKLRESVERLISRLIPRHVKRVSADAHDQGYLLGHNSGFDEGQILGRKIGYNKGKQKGYQAGRKKGYQVGHEIGYQEGFKDGKQVWQIDDHRASTNPKPIDQSIYGPSKFQITDAMQNAMRQAVQDAVRKKIVEEPTPDQWKMIFSDKPATCVIAGAGSGKSTTLILRIVFMRAYLKVPLNRSTS